MDYAEKCRDKQSTRKISKLQGSYKKNEEDWNFGNGIIDKKDYDLRRNQIYDEIFYRADEIKPPIPEENTYKNFPHPIVSSVIILILGFVVFLHFNARIAFLPFAFSLSGWWMTVDWFILSASRNKCIPKSHRLFRLGAGLLFASLMLWLMIQSMGDQQILWDYFLQTRGTLCIGIFQFWLVISLFLMSIMDQSEEVTEAILNFCTRFFLRGINLIPLFFLIIYGLLILIQSDTPLIATFYTGITAVLDYTIIFSIFLSLVYFESLKPILIRGILIVMVIWVNHEAVQYGLQVSHDWLIEVVMIKNPFDLIWIFLLMGISLLVLTLILGLRFRLPWAGIMLNVLTHKLIQIYLASDRHGIRYANHRHKVHRMTEPTSFLMQIQRFLFEILEIILGRIPPILQSHNPIRISRYEQYLRNRLYHLDQDIKQEKEKEAAQQIKKNQTNNPISKPIRKFRIKQANAILALWNFRVCPHDKCRHTAFPENFWEQAFIADEIYAFLEACNKKDTQNSKVNALHRILRERLLGYYTEMANKHPDKHFASIMSFRQLEIEGEVSWLDPQAVSKMIRTWGEDNISWQAFAVQLLRRQSSRIGDWQGLIADMHLLQSKNPFSFDRQTHLDLGTANWRLSRHSADGETRNWANHRAGNHFLQAPSKSSIEGLANSPLTPVGHAKAG